MILMRREAKRTKSSIDAIQAIHITFTLVSTWVILALTKKPCTKKWFKPWWPLAIILLHTLHTNNPQKQSNSQKFKHIATQKPHKNKTITLPRKIKRIDTYILIAKHHIREYGYWLTQKKVVDYNKVDEKVWN